MRKSPKFSPEVIERVERMVFDAEYQYPSQWAAIESIAGKIGCTAEQQRGIASRRTDGRWQVAITGSQGSGILSSMSAANGMVLLGHDQSDVAAGDEVDVLLPFDGLV